MTIQKPAQSKEPPEQKAKARRNRKGQKSPAHQEEQPSTFTVHHDIGNHHILQDLNGHFCVITYLETTPNGLKPLLFTMIKELMLAASVVLPDGTDLTDHLEIDLVEHLVEEPEDLRKCLWKVVQNRLVKAQQEGTTPLLMSVTREAKQRIEKEAAQRASDEVQMDSTQPPPSLAQFLPSTSSLYMNPQGFPMNLGDFLQQNQLGRNSTEFPLGPAALTQSPSTLGGAQPEPTPIPAQFVPLELQQGLPPANAPMTQVLSPTIAQSSNLGQAFPMNFALNGSMPKPTPDMQALGQLLLSNNGVVPNLGVLSATPEQCVPSTSEAAEAVDPPETPQVSPPVAAFDLPGTSSAFPFPSAQLNNLITTMQGGNQQAQATLNALITIACQQTLKVGVQPEHKPPCSTASSMPISMGFYEQVLREHNAPTYHDQFASTSAKKGSEGVSSKAEEDVAQSDEQCDREEVEEEQRVSEVSEKCEESLEGDSEIAQAVEQCAVERESVRSGEEEEMVALPDEQCVEKLTEEVTAEQSEQTVEPEATDKNPEDFFMVDMNDLVYENEEVISEDIETAEELRKEEDSVADGVEFEDDVEEPQPAPVVEDDFSRFLDPNYFANLEAKLNEECAEAERNGLIEFETDKFLEEFMEEKMKDDMDYNDYTAYGQYNGIHERSRFEPTKVSAEDSDSVKLARQLAQQDREEQHPVRENSRKRPGFFAESVEDVEKPKKSRRNAKTLKKEC